MDFTREPIVQTVITPKEGCKIVVRSSKNSGQEEYFVDAVEVISFGTAIFFRSIERPKSFLVPASDYEVLEVREARMVLKNVGVDRTIKIGGGREAPVKTPKEPALNKIEPHIEDEEENKESEKTEVKPLEPRLDKKRDRRRNSRRRRGRDDTGAKDIDDEGEAVEETEKTEAAPARHQNSEQEQVPMTSVLTSLLPPPLTLISETIARYRDNSSFKNAFFTKETDVEVEEKVASEGIDSVDSLQVESQIEQVSERSSSSLETKHANAPLESSLDQEKLDQEKLVQEKLVQEKIHQKKLEQENEETSTLFAPLETDPTHVPSLLGEEFSSEKLTPVIEESEAVTTEIVSDKPLEADEPETVDESNPDDQKVHKD